MVMNKVDKKQCIVMIPKILVFMTIAFITALLLIKLLWDWIIPDLFPGLVAEGLLIGIMSWDTAFKMAILATIVMVIKVMKIKHYMLKHCKGK